MSEFRSGIVLKCVGVSALAWSLIACGNGGTTTPTGPTPLGNSALSGSYVFVVTGTDANDGDYSVVGSFVADGKGNITSGVADYNLGSGVDLNVPLTGKYSSAVGVASVTLTDGGSVKDTFTTTLASSGSEPLANFDGSGSGTIYPQVTSGFVLPGSYSFSVTGEGDGVVTGSGQFVAGATGAFTGGNLTFMNGQTATTYSTVSGLLTAPATSGRGFANIAGNNLTYYVIGPNQIQMMGLDARYLLTIPAQKAM